MLKTQMGWEKLEKKQNQNHTHNWRALLTASSCEAETEQNTGRHQHSLKRYSYFCLLKTSADYLLGLVYS